MSWIKKTRHSNVKKEDVRLTLKYKTLTKVYHKQTKPMAWPTSWNDNVNIDKKNMNFTMYTVSCAQHVACKQPTAKHKL